MTRGTQRDPELLSAPPLVSPAWQQWFKRVFKVKKWITSSHDAIVLWEEKHAVVFQSSDVCKKPPKCHWLNNTLLVKKKKEGKHHRSICVRTHVVYEQAKSPAPVSFTAQLQASDQQTNSKTITVFVKTHHSNPFCAPHWCRTQIQCLCRHGEVHLVATALGWVQHPQLCCWLFSWGSARPNGVCQGVLETAQAWFVEAACKYLLSPIKPNPKAGASDNGLKPLLYFMFPIRSTWWVVCAVQLAAVCQMPWDFF